MLTVWCGAESDASELDRQRRLLCIKKADVRQLHRDTCGRLYTAVSPSACFSSVCTFPSSQLLMSTWDYQ